jgi:hypothetical protein
MRSTVATSCRSRILFTSSDSQAATERCVYGEADSFSTLSQSKHGMFDSINQEADGRRNSFAPGTQTLEKPQNQNRRQQGQATKNSHIYEERRKHGKGQKLASTVHSLALFLLPSALAAAPLTTTLVSALNLSCTFLALH